MSEVIEKLTKILNRAPTCSRLKDGKYMADYYEYRAPAKKFIADTEEEALKSLLEYLEEKPAHKPYA